MDSESPQGEVDRHSRCGPFHAAAKSVHRGLIGKCRSRRRGVVEVGGICRFTSDAARLRFNRSVGLMWEPQLAGAARQWFLA